MPDLLRETPEIERAHQETLVPMKTMGLKSRDLACDTKFQNRSLGQRVALLRICVHLEERISHKRVISTFPLRR